MTYEIAFGEEEQEDRKKQPTLPSSCFSSCSCGSVGAWEKIDRVAELKGTYKNHFQEDSESYAVFIGNIIY